MEGDLIVERKGKNSSLFQSTPSAWRETADAEAEARGDGISIHSLRMEGDGEQRETLLIAKKFQSTPSAWRETNCAVFRWFLLSLFQSTPSAWRETPIMALPVLGLTPISIHSLRMEGDLPNGLPPSPKVPFQSTPSAWRETPHRRSPPDIQRISIHSLRMEGDSISSSLTSYSGHFNPLPPHGGRH